MDDAPTVRKLRTGQVTSMQLANGKRSLAFTRAAWQALLDACNDGTAGAYTTAGIVLDDTGVTVTFGANTLRMRTAQWDTFVGRARAGDYRLGPDD